MKQLSIILLLLLSMTVHAQIDSSRVKEAKEFIEENNLNTTYAIFIDMSIHSGKYRLFLVHLPDDKIYMKSLVAHGCGQSNWGVDESKTNPVFSNEPGSHKSSLGKYRIGIKAPSSWGIGIHYKLHGLESTNSNAYKRAVVLHSWIMVPERELYPRGTPEGWGCPAVNDEVMRTLRMILDSNKDVLLWIYR